MYIIFDGSNIAYRANAVLDLSTDEGNVSAIYGMLMSIRYVISKCGPAKLIVAWDGARGKVARSKMYPAYKKHRETDDLEILEKRRELQKQIGVLKKILGALGVMQLCFEQLEADDVIAVCCDMLEGPKVIVSGDKDLIQLMSPEVSLWYPPKKKLIDYDSCTKEFGLPAEKMLWYKILVGDPSDGIKGVPGIGDVRATKLLQVVPNPLKETLLEHMDEIPAPCKKLLEKQNQEIIYRNRKLMDLSYKMDDKKKFINSRLQHPPSTNFTEFKSLLCRYRFVSLMRSADDWIRVFRTNSWMNRDA